MLPRADGGRGQEVGGDARGREHGLLLQRLEGPADPRGLALHIDQWLALDRFHFGEGRETANRLSEGASV